jgi:hypothetical protein
MLSTRAASSSPSLNHTPPVRSLGGSAVAARLIGRRARRAWQVGPRSRVRTHPGGTPCTPCAGGAAACAPARVCVDSWLEIVPRMPTPRCGAHLLDELALDQAGDRLLHRLVRQLERHGDGPLPCARAPAPHARTHGSDGAQQHPPPPLPHHTLQHHSLGALHKVQHIDVRGAEPHEQLRALLRHQLEQRLCLAGRIRGCQRLDQEQAPQRVQRLQHVL